MIKPSLYLRFLCTPFFTKRIEKQHQTILINVIETRYFQYDLTTNFNQKTVLKVALTKELVCVHTYKNNKGL